MQIERRMHFTTRAFIATFVILITICFDRVKGQCNEVRVTRGSTCKKTTSKIMCSIKCNEGLRIRGPTTIYCHNNNWYDMDSVNTHGLVRNSLYKYNTKCEDIVTMASDSRLARAFGAAPEPICSPQFCSKAYRGITKSGCSSQGCCWNDQSMTCHETQCGIYFEGMGKEICELSNCVYDEKTKNCFKEIPRLTDKQCSPVKCGKSYHGINKQVCTKRGCCWNQKSMTCHENQCSGSYRGISQQMCERKGCSYDAASHHCYRKSSSISGRSFSIQPKSFQSGSSQSADFSPLLADDMQVKSECPMLENSDSKMMIKCSDGKLEGSVCRIHCADSSTILRGKRRVTCLEGGKWDVSKEEVKEFYCQQIKSAMVCSDQPCVRSFPGMSKQSCLSENCCWNDEKKTCASQRCPNTFKGIPEKQCQKQGCAYNPTNLQCYVATRCPAVKVSPGLRTLCSRDNKQGSVCWFTCPDDDLVLHGPSRIHCHSKNGQWSDDTQPMCYPKKCVPLPPPNNGVHMSCTNASNISSVCKFSCSNPNQVLVGEEQTTCQFNGMWSRPQFVKCITPCAVSANLKEGAIDLRPKEDLIKVVGGKLNPARSGKCNSNGVIEVDFYRMKSLNLKLAYPDSSQGFHFTIQNQLNEIVAMAIGKKLYIGSLFSPTRVLSVFEDSIKEVTLELTRSDNTLVYSTKQSDDSQNFGLATIPNLSTSTKLFVYFNRYTILKPYFLGSGLCNVCVSYNRS